MSGASVNSDGDAECASGSSGNELSERKRKENIRIGLPKPRLSQIEIVAVDEDVEEVGDGVGAAKKQVAWEEDGTDEKGSGKEGGENTRGEEEVNAEGEDVLQAQLGQPWSRSDKSRLKNMYATSVPVVKLS